MKCDVGGIVNYTYAGKCTCNVYTGSVEYYTTVDYFIIIHFIGCILELHNKYNTITTGEKILLQV